MSISVANKANPLLQIPSAISLFGTASLVVVIFSSRPLRRKIHAQLVSFVALSDFMASMVYLFGRVESGTPLCWIQALTSNSFTVSSFFWSIAIAYQIYVTVNLKSSLSRSQIIIFHIFCWGLPVLLTLLVLTTNTYGHEDDAYVFALGCSITQRQSSPQYGLLLWEILAFYLWLWLSVVIIVFLYIRIGFRLYQMDVVSVAMSKAVLNIFLYPLILIICWAVNTYLVLAVIIDPDTPKAAPVWLHIAVVLPALQGAFSAIVFFSQNTTGRRHLLHIMSCTLLWSTPPSTADDDDNDEEEDGEAGHTALQRPTATDGAPPMERHAEGATTITTIATSTATHVASQESNVAAMPVPPLMHHVDSEPGWKFQPSHNFNGNFAYSRRSWGSWGSWGWGGVNPSLLSISSNGSSSTSTGSSGILQRSTLGSNSGSGSGCGSVRSSARISSALGSGGSQSGASASVSVRASSSSSRPLSFGLQPTNNWRLSKIMDSRSGVSSAHSEGSGGSKGSRGSLGSTLGDISMVSSISMPEGIGDCNVVDVVDGPPLSDAYTTGSAEAEGEGEGNMRDARKM